MAQATRPRRTIQRPTLYANGWSVGRRRLSPGDLAVAERSARTTVAELYRILDGEQDK